MSVEKTLLEKAFNDARKQISMLGEKEVQMTDYLIQPKYKTFEDWYTKQSKQEKVKTALTELIERLEEKIKICSSNNLEREAMGMIEAKAIATELLEKEREQIEVAYYRGKSDTQNPEQMSAEKLLEWIENSRLVVDPTLQLIKDGWEQSKQEEVNHVKDFHTWRLPNDKPQPQEKQEEVKCDQDNGLREAAEKVVKIYKAIGEYPRTDRAIDELEKALK